MLREKFKTFSRRAESLEKEIELRHKVKEQIEAAERGRREVDNLVEKSRKLETTLAEQSYCVEERTELNELKRKLEETEIDEDLLGTARFNAAQVERYEEKMRAIIFAEGKKEKLHHQVQQLDKELNTLRGQLDSNAPFEELMRKITKLELQIDETGFFPERFERVRLELSELKEIPGQMNELLNAEQNMSDWSSKHSSVSRIVGELVEAKGELDQRLHTLKEQLAGQEQVVEELSSKRARASELEQELKSDQQSLGELTARLNQVREAQIRLKQVRKEVREHEKEIHIYKKLRIAFGKNGIQSLIIEQALPEIEERASEILFRLTEGKMQVRLETIKDKKTGGTKETLDIVITDDQGIPRPYETFSGGEAFRVDFALRIALSQVLAERNGVRVRTLGIDEGFGTQDEEGIQNLIEAIQKVQDDFDKILVITHLDRLKQAFPVRIEVVKDPIAGSQLTYMEA